VTDVRFVAQLDQISGAVEGYPIPANFHGDVLEWVGTLRSVLEARDSFTMLELGAGWGPWCAIAHAAARQLGITTVRTTGVEGDAGHVAHMRENFAVNGLTAEEGRIICGVVGANDGDALFPKAIDASSVYGGAAAYEGESGGRQFFDLFVTGHGAEVDHVERMPCFSLKTLMAEAEYVDLIHCDVQGEEARLLSSAITDVSAKVGRIVVGTHSFAIDRQLLMLLPANGWELEGIDICEMREDGQLPVTLRDGTQVWRNQRFDNRRQVRRSGSSA
jgi:FkbM family methyltransferase